MKKDVLTKSLGIGIIILLIVGSIIAAGKMINVIKTNPYIYGFLLLLMIGACAAFLFFRYGRKGEKLIEQRISVIVFVFLFLFTIFLLTRSMVHLIRNPILGWLYFILLAVMIIAWFIMSKSGEKVKDFRDKGDSVVKGISSFLWESDSDKPRDEPPTDEKVNPRDEK